MEVAGADVLRHLCPRPGGGAALGYPGPERDPALEDDGTFLHFFGQLTDKLVEATTNVMELIDTECRDLLGLAGTCIFSNLQHLCPDLDLLDVL
jgi:hypothetical protein